MTEKLVSLIKEGAAEIINNNQIGDIYFRYQYLERLINQFIYLREPVCQAGIEQDSLERLIKIIPADDVLLKAEDCLKKLFLNLSLNGLAAAMYFPCRKSIFAIYEKIIDNRISRSVGLSFAEKKKRVNNFKDIIDSLMKNYQETVFLKDLVRSLLVFSNPEELSSNFLKVEKEICKIGFIVSETRYINIERKNDKLIFPTKIDSEDYIAIHYKVVGSRDFFCGIELQLRLAQNHWGPHMFKIINGYLNKYMASSVEEIDYSVDRLGLGIV